MFFNILFKKNLFNKHIIIKRKNHDKKRFHIILFVFAKY